MKQILLTLAIALTVSLSYGQRKVDISVRLNSPTASTPMRTGVKFNMTFTVKNNGPDDIKVGDTLAHFLGAGGQVFLGTQVILPALQSDISMNDSQQFTVQNMILTGGNGGPLAVCSFVVLINRALPDSVRDNNILTLNNRGCVTVQWSGVGIGELKAGDQFTTKVYPNPATSDMTIEFNADANQPVKVEIYDVQGKLVNTIENTTDISGTQLIQLNVADFNKGIYFYKVINGENVSSNKFTVE